MRRLLAFLFIAVLALSVFVQPVFGAHTDQGAASIAQVDVSAPSVLAPDVGTPVAPSPVFVNFVIPSYAYNTESDAIPLLTDTPLHEPSATSAASALNLTATNVSATADGTTLQLRA